MPHPALTRQLRNESLPAMPVVRKNSIRASLSSAIIPSLTRRQNPELRSCVVQDVSSACPVMLQYLISRV
jgi:hypothetical protein